MKSEERIQAVQQLSATNIASNYLYRILLERMRMDDSAEMFRIARNELKNRLDGDTAAHCGVFDVTV